MLTRYGGSEGNKRAPAPALAIVFFAMADIGLAQAPAAERSTAVEEDAKACHKRVSGQFRRQNQTIAPRVEPALRAGLNRRGAPVQPFEWHQHPNHAPAGFYQVRPARPRAGRVARAPATRSGVDLAAGWKNPGPNPVPAPGRRPCQPATLHAPQNFVCYAPGFGVWSPLFRRKSGRSLAW